MATKNNSIDMVNGPLWGKVLRFAVTYMITAFLQQLYNAADVIVVGRYAGQVALAGVGTCTVIVNLFVNFILGFSAGATIVLGQSIGANDEDRIEKTTHTSIAVAIIGGLIVSSICLIFAKQLLNLIDVPDNVMPEAMDYLRIVSIGFIPSLVYNFGASILRAKGDTKRALYIVTASGIINLGLNLFFVCVVKMKASGVAIATVASQIFTAVAIMYILCHETDKTKIYIRRIRFHKEPLLKIIRFGLPSGIQSSTYSISNVLVQSSVNSFGSAAIAGSSAVTSITTFYNVMNLGIYQSSLVFTSQNYGAKKLDRIKKLISVCLVYSICIWAIQCVVTFFFGKSLISLYAPNDVSAIEYGLRKMSIMGYGYGLLALMDLASGVLRGMGASFINMLTSIVGVCGIRIIWIFTVFKAVGTFETLVWCYPLSWFGTLCMHTTLMIIVYRKAVKNRTQTLSDIL